MSPETTYLEHLDSIERIAAFVARRGHLNPDDTVEFVQIVRVRLFDDDYAIIRKFEGRSSFTTYLTTVIVRLFHQWRVEQWGKWRPSAEARRLGDQAMLLERLVTRDGLTAGEAIRTLTTGSGTQCTAAELESLYVRLPLRSPRPIVVSEGAIPDVAATDSDAGERVESRDRERSARRAAEAIDGTLASMEPEDRLILQMRFWDGRKVPDIAKVLHLDQKKIYKRLDRLFLVLRKRLESAGVGREDVDKLLGRGDHEIRLELFSQGESPSFRLSHVKEGEGPRGDGGVTR